jgi:hypothetical protein
MNLRVIITALFFIFSWVYFSQTAVEYVCEIPQCVIYWNLAFFVAIYGLIAGLYWHLVRSAITLLERLYYLMAFIYFVVLIGLNAVCFINTDWYAPLIWKTKAITIPFIAVMGFILVLKIYTLIRKKSW